jgi:hypothetical protein
MGLELAMRVGSVLWELSWLVDYLMRGGVRMQVYFSRRRKRSGGKRRCVSGAREGFS